MAIPTRDAINNYDDNVRTLLANKQTIEKEIKDCASQ